MKKFNIISTSLVDMMEEETASTEEGVGMDKRVVGEEEEEAEAEEEEGAAEEEEEGAAEETAGMIGPLRGGAAAGASSLFFPLLSFDFPSSLISFFFFSSHNLAFISFNSSSSPSCHSTPLPQKNFSTLFYNHNLWEDLYIPFSSQLLHDYKLSVYKTHSA